MGGHDLVWWIIESGFWNRTLADLPSPAARLFSNPLATGHGGGHDLHYRTLHDDGRRARRSLSRASGRRRLTSVRDLSGSIEAGDGMAARLQEMGRRAAARSAASPIPWELPPPLRHRRRGPRSTSTQEGVRTVIWTTGYRPDYGWVHLPVFDDMGFPVQVERPQRGGRALLHGRALPAEGAVRDPLRCR